MENICAEWSDDKRMNALFAPLRNKDINPESWHSKIQFWLNLIEKWSEQNQIVLVDVTMLKKVFTRNGKTPNCLEDVLNKGINQKILANDGAYLQGLSSAHQSWGAWMVGLGTGTIKNMGSKLIGASGNTTSYTVIKTIDSVRTRILSELVKEENYIECRYSVIIREEQVNTILESIEDLKSRDYLLQTLLADRKLLKFSTNESTFYKILNNSSNKDFDDIDKGLVRLKLSIQHLEDKVKEIETEQSKQSANVKRLLKEGKRSSAKSILKRLKRLEGNLANMMEQQLGLEHLFMELQNAENNKILMETYETGLTTMKKMVDPDMIEKSENTMFELAELIDVNKQIGDTLVITQDQGDSEQLDDQLNELLKEMEDIKNKPSEDNQNIIRTADKTSVYSIADKPLVDDNISAEGTDMDAALDQLESLNLDDLDPLIPLKKDTKEKIKMLAA